MAVNLAHERELQEIRQRMGRAIMDRNLSPEQREETRQTYLRHYQEKTQELRDYARDSMRAPTVPRPTLQPRR